jgi:hypothetical protein
MASGKRSKAKRRSEPEKAAPLAVLSAEEVAALQIRHQTWQDQQRVAGLCQEAYAAYSRAIAEQYGLPPQFIVDFATGEVTPAFVQTIEVPAQEAATA